MKKNKIGKIFRKSVSLLAITGLILSLANPSIVSAADTKQKSDEFGKDYYDNTYTVEDFKLDRAANTPGKRMEVAKRHGWENYLDNENYLNSALFEKYSNKELTYLCQKDHEIAYLYNPDGTTVANKKFAIEAFSSRAASGNITSVVSTVDMGYTTAIFNLTDPTTGYNGEAFCAEHSKNTPPQGSAITNGGLVTNENIRKCVYYWKTGDISKRGSLYTFGYTSLAISHFNGDQFYNNNTFMDFISWIQNKPNAPSNFKVYWANTSENYYQNLVYGYTVPEDGRIRVHKYSANTNLTNGNNNYSLAGAQFTIYKDSACKNSVQTLTIKSDGYSEVSNGLAPATYYVKETKSADKGYQISNEVYKANVTSGNTPSNPAWVNVYEAPKTTKIMLTKSSTDPEVSNGNSNYKLAGAVYRIYTDKDCTKWTGKTITTDEKGTGSIEELALNEYWLKEYSAPNHYTLDKTVYYVDGRDQWGVNVIAVNLNVKERPVYDKNFSSKIAIQKVDSETGKPVAAGNGSLQGAEFEVKFYADAMTTDPAESGKKALYTWILKTDENGEIYFKDGYLVSGDKFIKDHDGNIVIPAGTLTFKEIKSPNGYLVNSEIQVVCIKNGDVNADPVYVTPIQKEKALSLTLVKTQAGTDKVIEGAIFEHTLPDGTKEQFTTDADGKIEFQGLQWGDHTIKEISVPDGYSVNKNPITFTVAEDNTVTITSRATETDTNGDIKLTVEDDGNISATFDEKLAPFDLHINKINNHNKVLEGAEFTVYSDADCKTEVTKGKTDDKGDLTFKDLIPEKDYYLKETKAPQGYRIPVNADGSDIVYKVRVESVPVDGTFNFFVNEKAYTTDSTGQFTVTGTKADRIVNMIITNETTQKLPNTGSNKMLIIMMMGMILAGTGIVCAKKKKRDL